MISKKIYNYKIYLLPNLLTTFGLFSAFHSIISSLNNKYDSAAIFIFFGIISDSLDGRIARLTNTQTEFGAQYDSLSDMVTFGIAPSLLLYNWGLYRIGKIGWLISFIYVMSVALRLARFNMQVKCSDNKYYFTGLACPSSAAIISSFIWYCYKNKMDNFYIIIFSTLIVIFTSLLMISNIKYNSFKTFDFRENIYFLFVFILIFLLFVIMEKIAIILFIIFFIYSLSGPYKKLLILKQIIKKNKN